MSTNWDKMSLEQRLTAATVDIMQHKDFCRLSGIVTMGERHVVEVPEDLLSQFKDMEQRFKIEMPVMFTAATNGEHCWYGKEFMMKQSRKQVRWVVMHENWHKGLHHCTEYLDLREKYPQLANMAQDFCINGTFIYEMDPKEEFAERPAGIKVCFDEKYFGWSWIDILRDLIKKQEGGGGGGKGKGKGGSGAGDGEGKVFDVHLPHPKAGQSNQEQKDAIGKIKRMVDDGMYQGQIIAERMAGKGKGNQNLDNVLRKRDTNWKPHMRSFVEQIIAGFEYSRFVPPSKRFLPLDILMPSHFAESTGEIHIYCDTSGSMIGVYPIVFGEIQRIAEQVKPTKLRVIWWDDGIHSEQEFTAKDYDQIGGLMKPGGGGGTSPGCVKQYVAQKGYKPKCGIWLTDGYLDGSDAVMPFPVLWGVVDNEGFVPPQGQKVNIYSNA